MRRRCRTVDSGGFEVRVNHRRRIGGGGGQGGSDRIGEEGRDSPVQESFPDYDKMTWKIIFSYLATRFPNWTEADCKPVHVSTHPGILRPSRRAV